MSGEPKRVRLAYAVPRRIKVSEAEMHHGAMAAVSRQCQNLTRGRIDRDGCGLEVGWDHHINGAIAEVAAARAVGRYWVGMGALGDLSAADILGAQVRWTNVKPPHLRITKRDRPDDVFILVTGLAPWFTVHGWVYAREGQRDAWWGDPWHPGRFSYWVPQDELHDLDLLPEVGGRVREPGEEG